jgi:hypothetical protein
MMEYIMRKTTLFGVALALVMALSLSLATYQQADAAAAVTMTTVEHSFTQALVGAPPCGLAPATGGGQTGTRVTHVTIEGDVTHFTMNFTGTIVAFAESGPTFTGHFTSHIVFNQGHGTFIYNAKLYGSDGSVYNLHQASSFTFNADGTPTFIFDPRCS